jgi:hypothetical protein
MGDTAVLGREGIIISIIGAKHLALGMVVAAGLFGTSLGAPAAVSAQTWQVWGDLLSGQYQSAWGVVTLQQGAAAAGGNVVTGSWLQPNNVGACRTAGGCTGEIRDGRYSGDTITFSYYQSWNNQTGGAACTVAERDHLTRIRKIDCNWSQGNGSGTWDMSRGQ